MFICLFFAILSSLLYINIVLSEIHSSPFLNVGDDYEKLVRLRSKIKYGLIVLASILWTIIFYSNS